MSTSGHVSAYGEQTGVVGAVGTATSGVTCGHGVGAEGLYDPSSLERGVDMRDGRVVHSTYIVNRPLWGDQLRNQFRFWLLAQPSEIEDPRGRGALCPSVPNTVGGVVVEPVEGGVVDYTVCRCKIHEKVEARGGCKGVGPGAARAIKAPYYEAHRYCDAPPAVRERDQRFAVESFKLSHAPSFLGKRKAVAIKGLASAGSAAVTDFGEGYCHLHPVGGNYRWVTARVYGGVPLVVDAMRAMWLGGLFGPLEYVVELSSDRQTLHIEVREGGMNVLLLFNCLHGLVCKYGAGLRVGAGEYAECCGRCRPCQVGQDFRYCEDYQDRTGNHPMWLWSRENATGQVRDQHTLYAQRLVDNGAKVRFGETDTLAEVYGHIPVGIDGSFRSKFVNTDSLRELLMRFSSCGVNLPRAARVDLALCLYARNVVPKEFENGPEKLRAYELLGDAVLRVLGVSLGMSVGMNVAELHAAHEFSQSNAALAKAARATGLTALVRFGAAKPDGEAAAKAVEALVGVVATYGTFADVSRVVANFGIFPDPVEWHCAVAKMGGGRAMAAVADVVSGAETTDAEREGYFSKAWAVMAKFPFFG